MLDTIEHSLKDNRSTPIAYPVEVSNDIQWRPTEKNWEPNTLGSYRPLNRAVIYNPDTGEVYHDHASLRYVPTPHDKLHEQLYDSLKTAGINPDNAEYKVEKGTNSLGTKGSRIRISYIFRDHCIAPAVDDYVAFKVDMLSSYDGSWPAQIIYSGLRLLCTNGMTTADQIYRIRHKHIKAISFADESDNAAKALENFRSKENMFREWTTTPVTYSKTMDIFKRLARVSAPLKKFNKNLGPMISEKQLEDINDRLWRYIDNLGETKWAAYNTLTDWSTHFDVTNGQAFNIRLEREQKVTKILRSKEWENLDARVNA